MLTGDGTVLVLLANDVLVLRANNSWVLGAYC